MRSSQDSIFINQFVAVVFLCKYFQDALKVSWAKTISAKYKTILPCNSSCPQFRVSCSEEGCEWIRGIPKVFKKVAFPPLQYPPYFAPKIMILQHLCIFFPFWSKCPPLPVDPNWENLTLWCRLQALYPWSTNYETTPQQKELLLLSISVTFQQIFITSIWVFTNIYLFSTNV